MIYCARRFRTNRDAAFLFLSFAVLFGFYAIVSFFRTPEPNWPFAAYPAATAAFGLAWTERERFARGAPVAGGGGGRWA